MTSLDDLSRAELLTLIRPTRYASPAMSAAIRAGTLADVASLKRQRWLASNEASIAAARAADRLMKESGFTEAWHRAFAAAKTASLSAKTDWIAFARAKAAADRASRLARRMSGEQP